MGKKLGNWGPLSAKKKKDAISIAFSNVTNNDPKLDLDDFEALKVAIHSELLKHYKMNQKKLETSEAFWANSNYDKHAQHLEALVSDKQETESMFEIPQKEKAKDGKYPEASNTTKYIFIALAIVAVVIVYVKFIR